jgi:hypothetical protein
MESDLPVILRYKGFRFFFYSNEGNPREPVHVHVRKGESEAKFWVDPDIALESSYEITSSQLREIEGVIRQNQELILRTWHEHFGE